MRRDALTLGILAGGRASRLGGVDKAWLRRGGMPQVLRWVRRFEDEVGRVLVSANRDIERYAAFGLEVVRDACPDTGPLGGLHALARVTTSEWLLTVPVDLIGVNECLLPSLLAAGEPGAFAVDAQGMQPLVALWRTELLRSGSTQALAFRQCAVHALQQALGMHAVRFDDVRYGNLNTPDDLRAAGVEHGDE